MTVAVLTLIKLTNGISEATSSMTFSVQPASLCGTLGKEAVAGIGAGNLHAKFNKVVWTRIRELRIKGVLTPVHEGIARVAVDKIDQAWQRSSCNGIFLLMAGDFLLHTLCVASITILGLWASNLSTLYLL